MASECKGNIINLSHIYFCMGGLGYTQAGSSFSLNTELFESVDCAYEGKTSWPELLGVQKEEAQATVERENPYVTDVEVVLEGTIVPADLVPVCTRVRIWVDENGTVTRVPVVG